MLRLTGGQWNRRLIQSPKDEAIRPTTARVRQSLFERLRPYLHQAKMLDLFAGSGLLGFEALSRGAESTVAIELNPKHVALIKANASTLGVTSKQVEVLQADVLKGFKNEASPMQAALEGWAPFDLIYLDPPYALQEGMTVLLQTLLTPKWLAEGGILILEQGKKAAFTLPVEPTQVLTYGDTTLFWFEAACV
jgi:16S rRNA (guanine966-N2)-methyltransferase